jgi:hypothetical protein
VAFTFSAWGRHRKLDTPLDLPIDTLDVMVVVPEVSVDLALPPHRQQIAGDRQGYFFLTDPRKLKVQNEIVLGFVHVEDRCPHANA